MVVLPHAKSLHACSDDIQVSRQPAVSQLSQHLDHQDQACGCCGSPGGQHQCPGRVLCWLGSAGPDEVDQRPRETGKIPGSPEFQGARSSRKPDQGGGCLQTPLLSAPHEEGP
ncbi:hypothetical protein CB1_001105001 [Camelus ferus]|nr:hypothetical protein CB1_001105001 [Camelus ferus]